MHERKTVRAVERALDILLCFLKQPSLSLTEIAEITQLNKSTVYRLLLTLEGKGFLVRDPDTEKYQLGFRIWELSVNLDSSNDPAILFLPEMERLRDQLDETISLYVRDGYERVRIQAVESRQAIRRVAPIGARLSLAVGASSKVLMAFEDSEIVEEVIQSPQWPKDIDPIQYRTQLKEIAQSGYAMSVEEREAGTAAIAVPIFNRNEKIVAALAVSGPVQRMSRQQMLSFLPALKNSGEKLGKMLRK